MSIFGSVLVILAAAQASVPDACDADSPVRDPTECDPLYSEDGFTIYSIESVAVGTIAEMTGIREMTRHCGVSNRIDGVDDEIAVYDIFDATKESRTCVRDWITENVPHLAFSEERLDRLFEGVHSSDGEGSLK